PRPSTMARRGQKEVTGAGSSESRNRSVAHDRNTARLSGCSGPGSSGTGTIAPPSRNSGYDSEFWNVRAERVQMNTAAKTTDVPAVATAVAARVTPNTTGCGTGTSRPKTRYATSQLSTMPSRLTAVT